MLFTINICQACCSKWVQESKQILDWWDQMMKKHDQLEFQFPMTDFFLYNTIQALVFLENCSASNANHHRTLNSSLLLDPPQLLSSLFFITCSFHITLLDCFCYHTIYNCNEKIQEERLVSPVDN